jgi:hypothetical protein
LLCKSIGKEPLGIEGKLGDEVVNLDLRESGYGDVSGLEPVPVTILKLRHVT